MDSELTGCAMNAEVVLENVVLEAIFFLLAACLISSQYELLPLYPPQIPVFERSHSFSGRRYPTVHHTMKKVSVSAICVLTYMGFPERMWWRWLEVIIFVIGYCVLLMKKEPKSSDLEMVG